MDVKFINICLRDVRDLQELFIYGLEIPSVNVCHRDVRSSVYITPDSDLPVLNGLGPESSPNCLNGLNILGLELAQEYWQVGYLDPSGVMCRGEIMIFPNTGHPIVPLTIISRLSCKPKGLLLTPCLNGDPLPLTSKLKAFAGSWSLLTLVILVSTRGIQNQSVNMSFSKIPPIFS